MSGLFCVLGAQAGFYYQDGMFAAYDAYVGHQVHSAVGDDHQVLGYFLCFSYVYQHVGRQSGVGGWCPTPVAACRYLMGIVAG